MSDLYAIFTQSGGFVLFALAAALFVAAAVFMPLWRGEKAQSNSEGHEDVTLYRAQIAAIDRDLQRGTIDPDEAARARTEVARRLLAADRHAARAQTADTRGRQRGAALMAALVLIGGSFALYISLGAPAYRDLPLAERIARGDELRASRPSQEVAEVAATPLPLPDGTPQDTVDAVLALESVLADRPDLLEGWQIIEPEERALFRFAAARVAMENIIRLKGDTATTAEHVEYLDMMAAAADLYVSPEAEAQARLILEREPDNFVALFYMGLLFAQTDRPDLAFQIWRPLVDRPDGDDLHMGLMRDRIEQAAFDAGVDYSLPPQGRAAAAVAAMGADDQQAMIRSMVSGLAERLATQGGPPEDWARLITSYGVLGEVDQARAIWTEAQQVFADTPAAVETIRAAAIAAGVAP